ncbi:MAG TPA: glycosyltransferase family 39 protein, partial [Caldilineaceae bacterium]|nr:glycosyltransferase family 39 protein [Caldilineaceae bacterium]
MLENVERGQVGTPVGAPAAAPLALPRSRVGLRNLLAVAAIVLAVWLPRAFQLDHFVTVDESKWLVRSANFYQALASGQLEHTFQHGHPGVTIMYAGMAGYLWQFPDYVEKETTQHRWGDEFMILLEEYGYKPIDLLAAGRTFIVLLNTLALALSFLYAGRLIGFWPALLAFLLIAFDPFQTALSRFLHPDSLLSTFMLLATLAFMAYLWAGRRMRDLIAAGAFTALAWLTKTPAVFLFPLVGLLTLIDLAAHVTSQAHWRWRDFFGLPSLIRVGRTLSIWAAVAVAVYVLLWPAMWVNARWTLTQVFDISSDYALQGHSSPVFFNGRIYNGDPGLSFYPINYLWRTTPVVMLGGLLLIGGFFWR